MIRLMTINDYESCKKLWDKDGGIGQRTLDDSYEGIKKFLDRNPTTCFVYRDNCVQGTILTGHDGRRGYIYHLYVHPKLRKKGIGQKLVDSAINALKKQGINKVALVVYSNNSLGNNFWERNGFTLRNDLNYRNKSINDKNT